MKPVNVSEETAPLWFQFPIENIFALQLQHPWKKKTLTENLPLQVFPEVLSLLASMSYSSVSGGQQLIVNLVHCNCYYTSS